MLKNITNIDIEKTNKIDKSKEKKDDKSQKGKQINLVISPLF